MSSSRDNGAIPEIIKLPDDDTPIEGTPIHQVAVSTRQTRNGVAELRSEMKADGIRNEKAHDDFKESISSLSGQVTVLNEHVGNLREDTAEMKADVKHLLRNFKRDERRADTQESVALVEQADTNKHKRFMSRKAFGGVIAAISALLGAIAHHFAG